MGELHLEVASKTSQRSYDAASCPTPQLPGAYPTLADTTVNTGPGRSQAEPRGAAASRAAVSGAAAAVSRHATSMREGAAPQSSAASARRHTLPEGHGRNPLIVLSKGVTCSGFCGCRGGGCSRGALRSVGSRAAALGSPWPLQLRASTPRAKATGVIQTTHLEGVTETAPSPSAPLRRCRPADIRLEKRRWWKKECQCTGPMPLVTLLTTQTWTSG